MKRTAFVLLVAPVALCLGLGASAGSASTEATAALRLDGVPFHPELALTPARRELGLMHRTQAPRDGMLFVFPEDSSDGFWMKNTLVPLAIVFFRADGARVHRMTMTPCRADPCRVYEPGHTYRFALELRAGDRRPARTLGPRASLRRLVARAS